MVFQQAGNSTASDVDSMHSPPLVRNDPRALSLLDAVGACVMGAAACTTSAAVQRWLYHGVCVCVCVCGCAACGHALLVRVSNTGVGHRLWQPCRRPCVIDGSDVVVADTAIVTLPCRLPTAAKGAPVDAANRRSRRHGPCRASVTQPKPDLVQVRVVNFLHF